MRTDGQTDKRTYIPPLDKRYSRPIISTIRGPNKGQSIKSSVYVEQEITLFHFIRFLLSLVSSFIIKNRHFLGTIKKNNTNLSSQSDQEISKLQKLNA